MTTANFSFSYPDLTGATSTISLKSGDVVFVLGANGTGKSGLMTKLSSQNQGKIKRILAHRQTWFNTNTIAFTPASKVQVEHNISHRDYQNDSRWKDDHHQQRSQITIFNLINEENLLARKALAALRSDIEEAKKIGQQETPIEALNHLLSLANLPIKISVEGDEKVFASKNNGPQYSIAQLSDGERNAVLIIADVLTAKPNTLFIIDEPERHLHRSIISPMLSSLFSKRKDCAFVVATHDIGLPLDNPQSSVLLIRGCKWQNENIIGWDTNIISATQEIDYHIKQDILGSRRNILFVEGNETSSLDKPIYSILYPEVSVIPQGDCKEVEKAVLGISSTQSLNWVKAFGLIDADDRQQEEIKELEAKNIFALPYYSVESLYYSSAMIGKIAERQASVLGHNADDLTTEAKNAIITAISIHKDRICARVCQRKIGAKLKSPTWKDILGGGVFKLEINLGEVLEAEKAHFDIIIAAKDTDKLVGRYPARDTEALTEVAKKLKFQTREDYERAVIKLLYDNQELREQLRTSIGNLTTAIHS